ncbi:hypothetical protein GCM10010214_56090 [Streptomyces abikoensis]|nr:hypothetical protein GCM10010214_56090 [Streptomyces abikoensis]
MLASSWLMKPPKQTVSTANCQETGDSRTHRGRARSRGIRVLHPVGRSSMENTVGAGRRGRTAGRTRGHRVHRIGADDGVVAVGSSPLGWFLEIAGHDHPDSCYIAQLHN